MAITQKELNKKKIMAKLLLEAKGMKVKLAGG